jgi:hypothetical protein
MELDFLSPYSMPYHHGKVPKILQTESVPGYGTHYMQVLDFETLKDEGMWYCM